MNELIFRGKDRYRPSWPQFAFLGVLLAAQGTLAAYRLGAVGFCWMLGGTAAIAGPALVISRRCWSAVGAAGITICWGVGRRGRTYPWRDIRWIDVRETKSRFGASYAVRMTLAGGKRRTLPGLQHSDAYPAADFDEQFHRVVNWWELSTDQAARVQPPKQLRDRLSPTALGVVFGILIALVAALVIAARG
ncbi:hypothetical protein [Kitasatospora sp. NPDC050463]|uniref:hypothetical protein n=1 Tax=Kitasatospora sp. NPDC050463 TaxID=3155786 RepID=UPI003410D216